MTKELLSQENTRLLELLRLGDTSVSPYIEKELKRSLEDQIRKKEEELSFRKRLIKPQYVLSEESKREIENKTSKEKKIHFDIYEEMAKKRIPFFEHKIEPLVPPEDEYLNFTNGPMEGEWRLAKDKNGNFTSIYPGLGQDVNSNIMKFVGLRSPKYIRTLNKNYPGKESETLTAEAVKHYLI